MKHAVWMLHDLVHGFEFYMGWYFTLPLVAALLLTGALVTFLTRSRKALLATALTLLLLFGGFALCQWTNVEWKLYCYGMYGQFHVPAPYSNDLGGETKMWEDRNPQKSVPATLTSLAQAQSLKDTLQWMQNTLNNANEGNMLFLTEGTLGTAPIFPATKRLVQLIF